MFQSLFTQDGCFHGCVHFKIDKAIDFIAFGETIDAEIFVLMHALDQIACDADI